MKILCTGDVHIGRRSSKLPAGIDSRTHASTEAWSHLVDLAIAECVDLVAVSGDLVDEANRFFEAFGPIERGVRRLSDAGIQAVVVAGNHDHEVLPRIIDEVRLDGVHFLGRGGAWERITLERGGVRLHVDGWSFPRARYETSPLADYAPDADGVPILALVHGDLDQPRSPYGPISTAELRRFSDTFFLLGHVHTPRIVNERGGARALYPGSPQALDPGEPGIHGAYLLTVRPEGFDAALIPVSTVRYEQIEVAVDELESVGAVEDAIAAAIRSSLMEHIAQTQRLKHLRCRIRLTGRLARHRDLDDRFRDRVKELELDSGSATASIERVEVDTRPNRDLSALGELHGAPGVLARLLTRLEAGSLSEADERLLRGAMRAVHDARGSSQYLELRDARAGAEPDASEVYREVGRAAALLLDELLAQREIPA